MYLQLSDIMSVASTPPLKISKNNIILNNNIMLMSCYMYRDYILCK